LSSLSISISGMIDYVVNRPTLIAERVSEMPKGYIDGVEEEEDDEEEEIPEDLIALAPGNTTTNYSNTTNNTNNNN